MDYERIEGGFMSRIPLSTGYAVLIKANTINKERSGVHANVSVHVAAPVLNGTPQKETMLAYDNLNLDKHEERVRLGRGGFAGLSEANQLCLAPEKAKGETIFRHFLDEYCAGLWEAHLRAYESIDLEGNADPKPPNYRLKPYILEGGGTILFGPPGRGKSFMMLLMLVSIDAGVTKFWPVRQAKCLFINLERSGDSIRQRLGAVNRILGLPATRPLLTLNARGRTLQDVAEIAKRDIRKAAARMVGLDSISRAGYGDLNENRPVNAIVDTLNNLSPTWLALGHTPRSDESHVFGSVHFDAGADVTVQLSSCLPEPSRLGVALKLTKANDMPMDRTPRILALEFNETGLANVREPKEKEFPDLLGTSDETELVDAISEYILGNGPQSATKLEALLGYERPRITKAFADRNRFAFHHSEGHQKFFTVRKS